jgi:RNA polymerase sigma-70 factor (ECF subfamily)
MNERAAVERARKGDLDAFGELLRVHQAEAQRLAYVITGQTGDAEDAVQEAFVKAWRAMDGFDAARPFRPWLLKIVANEARMRRRSAGQRQRLKLRLAEEANLGSFSDRSPETTAIGRESMRRILDEIERLPEPDEIVLKLRYFLGMSTAEIAATLDEPEGTVRSRLSRASRKLRERVTADLNHKPADTTTWRRPANDRQST